MLVTCFLFALPFFIAIVLLESLFRHRSVKFGLKGSVCLFFIGQFVMAFLSFYSTDKNFPEFLVQAMFLYFLWAFFVIVLVNAQNSFSLGVLRFLSKESSKITLETLKTKFHIEESIAVRIQALTDSGFLTQEPDGSLNLSPLGHKISSISHWVIRILRIQNIG